MFLPQNVYIFNLFLFFFISNEALRPFFKLLKKSKSILERSSLRLLYIHVVMRAFQEGKYDDSIFVLSSALTRASEGERERLERTTQRLVRVFNEVEITSMVW